MTLFHILGRLKAMLEHIGKMLSLCGKALLLKHIVHVNQKGHIMFDCFSKGPQLKDTMSGFS